MVVDDEHVFTGSDEIIQYLRTQVSKHKHDAPSTNARKLARTNTHTCSEPACVEQGSDLDSSLGQQDRAEVFAFASMVEGQLLTAMVRSWPATVWGCMPFCTERISRLLSCITAALGSSSRQCGTALIFFAAVVRLVDGGRQLLPSDQARVRCSRLFPSKHLTPVEHLVPNPYACYAHTKK